MLKSYFYKTFTLFLALNVGVEFFASAQEKVNQEKSKTGKPADIATDSKGRAITQFSGLVVSGERAFGVRGASVVFPRSNRGTSTNGVGYFSIPILAGDTSVISAVGFSRQYYVVPLNSGSSHSVIIYLQADTMQLPAVDITPFPTEALFKEAFLALHLDNRDVNNARANLDPYKIADLATALPMDGAMNYTNYMNNHIRTVEQQKMAPQLQLLNPFAWAQFIQSVKRGDFKSKKRKEEE
jgi:hypothetical protein